MSVFQENLNKELQKAVDSGRMSITVTSKSSGDNTSGYTYQVQKVSDDRNFLGGWGMVFETDASKDFTPVQIIFSPPATICFFPDGSKVVVKVSEGDKFSEDYGVMACITKKILGSRNALKTLLKSAYRPQEKTEE